ncbi:MAG: hypothetical protein R2771_13355 [Saprospiraceae bacterium]
MKVIVKIKYIFILLFLVNKEYFFAQKTFDNINSVPVEWRQRSLDFLNQTEMKYKKNEIKTLRDSATYFRNIASMYANLGESADTVFYYLDKMLSLSRYYGCFMLNSHEGVMKNSKNGMYFGNLDSARYFKILRPCQKYLEERNSEEIQKIKQNNSYDQNMIKLIEKMHDEDQLYRQIDRMDLQKKYDDKNLILLDSIFKNYGFPGKTRVGQRYSSYIMTIFLHTPIEYQEKNLPFLIENLKTGELMMGDMTYVLDRIYTFKYQKQFYGTQKLFDGSGNEIKIEKYTEEEKKKIFKELGIDEYMN